METLAPPVAPMLAKLARELPRGGYLYEPKWDGFRCLAFRSAGEVDLRSRNQRPLARYFPEIVEALLSLPAETFVVDGELVVVRDGRFDFEALLSRLHPAASRVERLRGETPATFIAFDVVAVAHIDLRATPFRERRRRLEELLRGAAKPLRLTPLTDDPAVAESWLVSFQGGGIDGVVAKHEDGCYVPGRREMVKVKREHTAECVVGGYRLYDDRPVLSSLLLGLYDDAGTLTHIGVSSSFTEQMRRNLLEHLRPYVVPLAGHPWERGFVMARGPSGRLKGAAGVWRPDERDLDWVPVSPELVCEVAYDQLDDHKLRHPARFRHWRPDRDARSCGLEQLDVARPLLDALLATA